MLCENTHVKELWNCDLYPHHISLFLDRTVCNLGRRQRHFVEKGGRETSHIKYIYDVDGENQYRTPNTSI